MVAVAFAANFLSTGTSFYVFNALLLPLNHAHGWTRAELNMAPMLGFACGLVGQFTYGTIISRVGARSLMALGPLLASLAFVTMGRVDSLAGFYLCYMLLLLGNGAMGGLVTSTLVSNWFEVSRGRALGLATMGISLSGAVMPPVAGLLLDWGGLQSTFTIIGLSLMAMSPLAWWLVRNSPEAMGLRPDGHGPGHAEPGRGEDGPDPDLWTPRQLARSSVFWRLGAAYALVMIGVMGVVYQLAPRFQDEGWGVAAALRLVACTALAGTVGKYVWGHLCDHLRPQRVAGLVMAGNAAGLGLGMVMGSAWGAAAFVLVFGFAMGGIMSTYPIITAHIFGRASFPRVFRFMLVFMAAEVAGYLVMGQSFARTGSYDTAYLIFVGLDLAAAALVWSLPDAGKPGPAPISHQISG